MLIDPGASGVRVERLGPFIVLEILGCTFVRLFFDRRIRIPSVADHTVVPRHVRFIRLGEDLLHHFGPVISDVFDTLMAFKTTVAAFRCKDGAHKADGYKYIFHDI